MRAKNGTLSTVKKLDVKLKPGRIPDEDNEIFKEGTVMEFACVSLTNVSYSRASAPFSCHAGVQALGPS